MLVGWESVHAQQHCASIFLWLWMDSKLVSYWWHFYVATYLLEDRKSVLWCWRQKNPLTFSWIDSVCHTYTVIFSEIVKSNRAILTPIFFTLVLKALRIYSICHLKITFYTTTLGANSYGNCLYFNLTMCKHLSQRES